MDFLIYGTSGEISSNIFVLFFPSDYYSDHFMLHNSSTQKQSSTLQNGKSNNSLKNLNRVFGHSKWVQAPVKRSQLFMQQHATFVVKKKFVPFDHLVVCCCVMLHVVVSCCMKFARDQKCLKNKCCAIEHFFCFQRCCMLLLSFDHLPKLCCVRACAVGFWFPAIIDLTLYLLSTCPCEVSRVQVWSKIWE